MRRLAGNIEQLVLALDHISQTDANNARFALMLVDNLVEITLHHFATHTYAKHAATRRYKDTDAVLDPVHTAALGQKFKPKVQFAQLSELLSKDVAASVVTLHSFRNEIYHVGLQHEAVLPALATFYFHIACDLLLACAPSGYSYSPGMRLPDRAAKYFSSNGHFIDGIEQYKKACIALKQEAGESLLTLITSLASHMSDVVAQQDVLIDIIARNGPETMTRNEAIVSSQAWLFAFTDAGKLFAKENGCPATTVWGYVQWISETFKWDFYTDPLLGWRKRAERVKREANSHKALTMYRDFMRQTTELRDIIYESAGQVEAYIEEQIERARGNSEANVRIVE